MLIGRALSAASIEIFVGFGLFVFSSAIFISWINMEIQTHKRMQKAKVAGNNVRVLLEEVALERAMYSLPTIRQ